MKNQALFSSIDINKKLKCRLLQFLFGALMVKFVVQTHISFYNAYFTGHLTKNSSRHWYVSHSLSDIFSVIPARKRRRGVGGTRGSSVLIKDFRFRIYNL